MRLTRVTPPVDFIQLDEARDHCRVDEGVDDQVLQRAIDAAISYLDGYRGILRRCIVNQVWRLDIARPGQTVRLPFPDINDISVVFTDAAAGPVPFEACHDGLAVNFGTRHGRPLSITFTAGFGEAGDVPPAIRAATLMLVDFFYSQRGGLSEGPGFPPEADTLLAPYKVWRV